MAYGEKAEAYEAWKFKKPHIGEEVADVAIYLMGISEILGIDLEKEILGKLEKNKHRQYKVVDGVTVRISK